MLYRYTNIYNKGNITDEYIYLYMFKYGMFIYNMLIHTHVHIIK